MCNPSKSYLTEEDIQRLFDNANTKGGNIGSTGECGHPGCKIPFHHPAPAALCICKSIMLYVPPGEHRHMTCPVHGDIVIYGSNVSF